LPLSTHAVPTKQYRPISTAPDRCPVFSKIDRVRENMGSRPCDRGKRSDYHRIRTVDHMATRDRSVATDQQLRAAVKLVTVN
jgi:hypothetical protein